MKIYGLNPQALDKGYVPLQGVSFVAEASELRRISQYFLGAAERLEQKPAEFDHYHIGNVMPQWNESWPDIIIAKDARGNHA